jgi:hypothetical protein
MEEGQKVKVFNEYIIGRTGTIIKFLGIWIDHPMYEVELENLEFMPEECKSSSYCLYEDELEVIE